MLAAMNVVCVGIFLGNDMGSCASRRAVAIITAKAPSRVEEVDVRTPEVAEASLVVPRSLEGEMSWRSG